MHVNLILWNTIRAISKRYVNNIADTSLELGISRVSWDKWDNKVCVQNTY